MTNSQWPRQGPPAYLVVLGGYMGQGPLGTYITLQHVVGSFSLNSIFLKECSVLRNYFVNNLRGRGPIIVSKGAPTCYLCQLLNVIHIGILVQSVLL